MPDPFMEVVADFYQSVLQWHRQMSKASLQDFARPHGAPAARGGIVSLGIRRAVRAEYHKEHHTAMTEKANRALATIESVADARWRHALREQCIQWFNKGFLLIHPGPRPLAGNLDDIGTWGSQGMAMAREVRDAGAAKDRYLPASHYKTHNDIETSTLRKAAKNGHVKTRGSGRRKQYLDYDVRQLWPENFLQEIV